MWILNTIKIKFHYVGFRFSPMTSMVKWNSKGNKLFETWCLNFLKNTSWWPSVHNWPTTYVDFAVTFILFFIYEVVEQKNSFVHKSIYYKICKYCWVVCKSSCLHIRYFQDIHSLFKFNKFMLSFVRNRVKTCVIISSISNFSICTPQVLMCSVAFSNFFIQ